MNAALILIVEDNDKNRKLARDVLQFKGYRTAEAATGAAALRLAKDLQPALILMDIQLPDGNGIDLLQTLRADPATRSIPVIAVTASAMPEDRTRIKNAGFAAYESKPISVKPFLETVQRVLAANPPAPPS